MEFRQNVDQSLLRGRAHVAASSPNAVMDQLPLALFDEIEYGLMICDGDGLLRFTNQAASRELGCANILLRQEGRLCTASGATGKLAQALRQAADHDRRSLVRMDRHGDRLMLSVLPFGEATAGSRHVLVTLGRRQPCSELGLEMLAASYGLTLAERRVLALLLRDALPREIAAQHAVALSTVRTQIQSIRTKLGARNVEGLLLRVTEVPPMTSALRGGHSPQMAMLAAA